MTEKSRMQEQLAVNRLLQPKYLGGLRPINNDAGSPGVISQVIDLAGWPVDGCTAQSPQLETTMTCILTGISSRSFTAN